MSNKDANDFWPAEIVETTAKPPVAILKEQAAFLGQKTRNVVIASVSAAPQNEWIQYSFVIEAPALGGYKYRLFTMRQDLIRLYPLHVTAELEAESGQVLNRSFKIENEEQLLGHLKKILTNPRTLKAVQSMLAQSAAFS